MATETYDVVVVGAGIEGSAAAYYCVQAGKRVLLLEQFVLPHTRGSSHGGHRGAMLTTAIPHNRPILKEAFQLWEELERETGVSIKREVGTLVVTESEEAGKDGFAKSLLEGLYDSEVNPQKLTTEERNYRYPNFTFSSKFDVYLYPRGGYLMSNKALSCFQSEFLKRGGIIRDGEKVLEIEMGVTAMVKTNQGEYRAKSVIITAGPWTSKILRPLGLDLPLTVKRVSHMFWKEKTEGTYKDHQAHFHVTHDGFVASSTPSIEYPGLMKCSVWNPQPIADPDLRDSMVESLPPEVELSRQYVKEHFPGLEFENGPHVMEPCLVTDTPDYDFLVDVHPEHKNIVFACGFSGGGFTFAPAVGKVLCQLAIGQTPTHDITPLSIRRFIQKE